MTHPQHEHRRHRLSRQAWRSPGWHGCSYIRRLDGQLSSHHTYQRQYRLSSGLREQAGALQIVEGAGKLSATACWVRRRRLTARAACTGDSVLGFGFLAGTLERGLLAAGALGFGCADAGLGCAGAAAAGGWDSHDGLRKVGWGRFALLYDCGIEWSGVVLEIVFENTMNVR